MFVRLFLHSSYLFILFDQRFPHKRMEWLQLPFSLTTSWLLDVINTRRREQRWSTCLAPPEWYNMNQRLLAYFTSRRSDWFWFIGSRVLRFICSPQNPLHSNSSSICTHKHYAATPRCFWTTKIFMNLHSHKLHLVERETWKREKCDSRRLLFCSSLLDQTKQW